MEDKITDGIVRISDVMDVKDPFQEYWLYFISGQSKLQNWFCKGYGHIFLLTSDQKNWYLIDPTPYRLENKILPFVVDKILPKQLVNLTKAKFCIQLIIDTRKIKKITYRWWHFFLPRFVSCISIIEYILGIKLKGKTPYGVIKYLKKFKNKCPLNNGLVQINFIKEM